MNLFFSGIGGSGVSAIACFMRDRGHRVRGSDRAFDRSSGSHPALAALLSKGIEIVSQDGRGIDSSLDLMVISTAVEADNPEIERAKSLGVKMLTRPEFLAMLVGSHKKTLAVAGTSGKSTTSGMLAYCLNAVGKGPNFIGGGRVVQFKTASNPGNYLSGRSDLLIIEACESDGSIVNYAPADTVILNLSLDHHSIEKTSGLFKALASNTKGRVIINADDAGLSGLFTGSDTASFSIENESDYKADGIALKQFGSEFLVNGAEFKLGIPGRHNVYNALASIACMSALGIPLKDMAVPMAEFKGIERRFQVHYNEGGKLVIDDYAHNPHKIEFLMDTVRTHLKSVCYIFQPHGYGPTRLMKDEYIKTFREGLRDADHLMLLPIYYAGGTTVKDISSEYITGPLADAGKSAQTVQARADAIDIIISNRAKWDGYVVFGARDETLSGFSQDIAAAVGRIKT